MLILALFLTAISISIEVHSAPLQILDLENILKYAREDNSDRKNRENLSGTLRSQEIVDLVQKAKEDNVFNDADNYNREYKDAEVLLSELNNKYNKRYNNKKDKITFGHYYDQNKDFDRNELDNEEENDDNDERYKSSLYNQQALEELLSQSPKKYNNKNNKNNDYSQEEYSKVYIILNPQAIEKSENKRNLDKLLSSVLSLTSSPVSSSAAVKNKRYKEQRYKGFPVNSGLYARRVRRDSREIYSRDSGEDEYKPKRGRHERGGGGGSGVGIAGGRTAIPYVRNRGDIYERDH